MDSLNTLFGLLLITGGFILGIYVESLTTICPENREVVGLWSPGNWTEFEFSGRWIHVKVEGRTINDSLETCRHEVAHEIFARECSLNMTPCIELVDGKSS